MRGLLSEKSSVFSHGHVPNAAVSWIGRKAVLAGFTYVSTVPGDSQWVAASRRKRELGDRLGVRASAAITPKSTVKTRTMIYEADLGA